MCDFIGCTNEKFDIVELETGENKIKFDICTNHYMLISSLSSAEVLELVEKNKIKINDTTINSN